MYHFLLGGYDLEMLEIRKILEIHNQPFTDLNLSWGATLDAYQEAIQANLNHVFVGIELVIESETCLQRNGAPLRPVLRLNPARNPSRLGAFFVRRINQK